jgi:ribosomal protein S6--L-glutamate ligase
MKIGILSRNSGLYSTQRLQAAARDRGHDVHVLDTLLVARQMGLLSRASGRRFSQYRPRVDAIIPRIGTSITRYGVAVVRQFETRGTLTTATAQGIAASRDKLQSWRLMQRAGLPLPRTCLVEEFAALDEAVASVGMPPVVIKVLSGTQGRGVILARTLEIARTVTSVLFEHGQKPILIQEFIQEADGTDIRLLVVGKRCVATMQRRAKQGDFRSNLHLGGTSAPVTVSEETQRLGVRAAALHRLGVAGVDVIPSDRGPLLLEVNSSPGLEGIEFTSEVDVATEIVQFLETKQYRQRKKRRRHR